jgi:Protein of unknown function (DUF1573)
MTMKHLLSIFSIALLFAACTSTDKQASPSVKEKTDSLNQVAMSDTANFTTLQWLDSTNQNLGKVKEGQVVEIAWRFKNTGNKPLIIANVQPGCGCTVADKPGEPVAPGNTGTIKARFDSKNHPGVQNKDVWVRANNSNKNTPTENQLTFHVEVEK